MIKFAAYACAGQSISDEAQEKLHRKSYKKTTKKIAIFRNFLPKSCSAFHLIS